MNDLDKMELNELRLAMWEIFSRIAQEPKHERYVQKYIRLMERHQEILAGRED